MTEVLPSGTAGPRPWRGKALYPDKNDFALVSPFRETLQRRNQAFIYVGVLVNAENGWENNEFSSAVTKNASKNHCN